MSELITQTARLVPYAKRPKQVSSYVSAYVYEPMADDPGAPLGNLYVVMEILVSGRASVEVADLIIDTVGDSYYNQARPTDTALERFEAAVKAVNHQLSEHVNRGNASWIGKLSAVVAVLVGSELHVTQTGSAEAFLYRGKATTKINAGSSNRQSNPSKTFGAIATGQLEAGDRILFATPALVHQIPLARLQSIISQAVPNTAIAEITELLKGTAVDRIGALVIEATTPELAALQVRSEQPSEIQLGTPETPIEVAKMAATPIAQSTVTSTKKLAKAAHRTYLASKPKAHAASLAFASSVREGLSHKRIRIVTMATATTLVLLLVGWLAAESLNSQSARYTSEFQKAYDTATTGDQAFSDGNLSLARSDYAAAQKDLAQLTPHRGSVDSALKKRKLSSNEPSSLEALVGYIANKVNRLSHITAATATTVAKLSSNYGNVNHFEIHDGYAYLFGSSQHGEDSLTVVNLNTGNTTTSSANVNQLGQITATTLAYDGSGIYIMTAGPAVWFYRFSSDSLSRLSTAAGQWPNSQAIASYYTNLYFLSNNTVYKATKNGVTFSAPQTDISDPNSTTGMAIDGSIYIVGPSVLTRYLLGSVSNTTPLPDGSSSITNLRSFNQGNTLLAVEPQQHLILQWSVTNGAPRLIHIYMSPQLHSLADASIGNNSVIYALSGNQLVRVSASR